MGWNEVQNGRWERKPKKPSQLTVNVHETEEGMLLKLK